MLKHLDYDPVHKKLSWRKLKLDPEEALQSSFYDKLPARDIVDIFRLLPHSLLTATSRSVLPVRCFCR